MWVVDDLRIVGAQPGEDPRQLSVHHSSARSSKSGKENLTLEEHERIADSIERKDADAAVDALRMHLDRSRDLCKHRS
jgi:DNA-binding GntR family transcriptional regulator